MRGEFLNVTNGTVAFWWRIRRARSPEETLKNVTADGHFRRRAVRESNRSAEQRHGIHGDDFSN